MPSPTVLLLDTNVWGHLVLNTEAQSKQMQADLDRLLEKYPAATRATSAICVAECWVGARVRANEVECAAAEQAFAELFASPTLMVVEVTQSLLDRAATLRADALRRARAHGPGIAAAYGGKLKLPDAIIAASCLDFDPPAVLVTQNVRDFQFFRDNILHTVAGLTVEKVG